MVFPRFDSVCYCYHIYSGIYLQGGLKTNTYLTTAYWAPFTWHRVPFSSIYLHLVPLSPVYTEVRHPTPIVYSTLWTTKPSTDRTISRYYSSSKLQTFNQLFDILAQVECLTAPAHKGARPVYLHNACVAVNHVRAHVNAETDQMANVSQYFHFCSV